MIADFDADVRLDVGRLDVDRTSGTLHDDLAADLRLDVGARVARHARRAR